MFSSRNKRTYQKIDDDFDDERVDTSSCFFAGVNQGRSLFFGGNNEENRSLIAGPSESYHDVPNDIQNNDDQFVSHGPPTMASSQLRSNRWDHIDNLDEFFTNIYEYHQNGGFLCITLKKIFGLIQFVFIISFSTFFTQCIDYNFLFADSNMTTHGTQNVGKRHFSDAVVENCPAHMSFLVVLAILAAIVYWITRVIKTTTYLLKMQQIQLFYKTELEIEDNELLNLTWHSIVKKVGEVQPRLRLMIHSDNISSIDIYHRILRYKNYMVALMNKRILFPIFNVPFLGNIAYFPNSFKHAIERILFKSSTAPWNGPHLKEEYRCIEMSDDLTKKLMEDCRFYGFVTLFLMPLMLPFQILESCFSLAELIKRSPDGLGSRRYSNFGRYMMRHFNELDHELDARLNRSYVYATAYMEQFFSPVLKIVAKNVTFVAAAIGVTLAALSAWDEDVLQVEHVITVISVSGVIIVICRALIPDENLVWRPEGLLTHVASELHYLPTEWKGKAHTAEVRKEFDQIFQMKINYFVMELTSPIFLPFILLFWLRPRCGELIKFLHDHTQPVEGLGDICSFAMMDVGKTGDPEWNNIPSCDENEVKEATPMVSSKNRAMDGKTEMSIIHFKTTNPEWKPPKDTELFIQRFKNRLGQESSMLAPLNSLNIGTLGKIPENLNAEKNRNVLLDSVHSILPANLDARNLSSSRRNVVMGAGNNRLEGPSGTMESSGGIMSSLCQEQPKAAESLTNSLRASGVDIDGAGAEMRIQALYLRGLHDESRLIQSRMNYGGTSLMPHNMQSVFAIPAGFDSKTESLIDVESGPSTSNMGRSSRAFGEMSEMSTTRSRLIFGRENGDEVDRHEVIEEDDEDEPPLSFKS